MNSLFCFPCYFCNATKMGSLVWQEQRGWNPNWAQRRSIFRWGHSRYMPGDSSNAYTHAGTHAHTHTQFSRTNTHRHTRGQQVFPLLFTCWKAYLSLSSIVIDTHIILVGANRYDSLCCKYSMLKDVLNTMEFKKEFNQLMDWFSLFC